MISKEEAKRIKNLKDEISCKNCLKLGVCWLTSSVSCPLESHKEKTGVLMFDWPKLAEICTQYASVGEHIEITENLM